MMNIQKAIENWEKFVQDLLYSYNDQVEVFYKPEVSGSSSDFDSFFNEPFDSSDPSNYPNGINVVTKPSVILSGKFHSDLYSYSFSNNDINQQIDIGSFEQSDALFTCLYSDCLDQNGEFILNNIDYIYSLKDSEKYEVVAIKKRGLGKIYLVDIFLKRTNK